MGSINLEVIHIFENLEKVKSLDFASLQEAILPIDDKLLLFEKKCSALPVLFNNIKIVPSSTYKNVKLKILSEFYTVQTTGDGNCMFSALSIIFFGDEEQSSIMRLLLLRHVLKHWEKLSKNCKSLFDCELSVMVKNLIQLNVWGTEKHLFLFSEVFSRPIFTFQYFSKTKKSLSSLLNSNPANLKNVPIYMSLCEHHWEPLISKTSFEITTITTNNSVNLYAHVVYLYSLNETKKVSKKSAGRNKNSCFSWDVSRTALNHICGNMEWFKDYYNFNNEEMLQVADTSKGFVPVGRGKIKGFVQIGKKSTPFQLEEVFYIPGSPNVISVPVLMKKGFALKVEKKSVQLISDCNTKLDLTMESDKLFLYVRPSFDNANENTSALTWHFRFMHVDFEIMLKMAKCGLVAPYTGSEDVSLQTSCDLKQISTPQERRTCLPGEEVGICIYSNAVQSINKNKYSLLIKDHATDFIWSGYFSDLHGLKPTLQSILKSLKNLKIVRIECTTTTEQYKIIHKLVNKLGIKLVDEEYNPLLPEQTRNTFHQIIRKLNVFSEKNKFPEKLWEIVLEQIICINNITLQSISEEKTPYEKINFKKPDMSHLRVLGSAAYAFKRKEKRFSDFVLVGYNEDMSKYKLYDKYEDTITESSDALFFEEKQIEQFNCSSKKNSFTPMPTIADASFDIRLNDGFSLPSLSLDDKNVEKCFSDLQNIQNVKQITYIDTMKPITPAIEEFRVYARSQVNITMQDFDLENFSESSVFSDCNQKELKEDFFAIKTLGDGNCFFRSIGVMLFRSDDFHKKIRLLLLRHLIVNWKNIEQSCSELFGHQMSYILQTTKTLNLFAEDFHMFMMSNILKRPIFIFFASNKEPLRIEYFNCDPKNKNAPPVFLTCIDNHVEPLVPRKPLADLSIFRATCYNSWAHVDYRYISKDVCPVITSKFNQLISITFCRSNTLYPSLQLNDNEENAAVYPELSQNCNGCRMREERLLATCKSNNMLHDDIRRLTRDLAYSLNYPKQKLCFSCDEFKDKLNKNLAEKEKQKMDFNSRGTKMIQEIIKLKTRLISLETEKGELIKCCEVYNEAAKNLRNRVVILYNELEKNGLANVPSSADVYTMIKAPQPGRTSPALSVVDNLNAIANDISGECSPNQRESTKIDFADTVANRIVSIFEINYSNTNFENLDAYAAPSNSNGAFWTFLANQRQRHASTASTIFIAEDTDTEDEITINNTEELLNEDLESLKTKEYNHDETFEDETFEDEIALTSALKPKHPKGQQTYQSKTTNFSNDIPNIVLNTIGAAYRPTPAKLQKLFIPKRGKKVEPRFQSLSGADFICIRCKEAFESAKLLRQHHLSVHHNKKTDRTSTSLKDAENANGNLLNSRQTRSKTKLRSGNISDALHTQNLPKTNSLCTQQQQYSYEESNENPTEDDDYKLPVLEEQPNTKLPTKELKVTLYKNAIKEYFEEKAEQAEAQLPKQSKNKLAIKELSIPLNKNTVKEYFEKQANASRFKPINKKIATLKGLSGFKTKNGGKFRCPHCDSTNFSSKGTFQRHLNAHLDRPVWCTEKGCNTRFLRMEYLIKHRTRFHGNDPTVMMRNCRFCPKILKYKNAMLSHEKSHRVEIDKIRENKALRKVYRDLLEEMTDISDDTDAE